MKNIVENRKFVNNVLDTYIRKFKVNPKRKNDILEAVIDKLY